MKIVKLNESFSEVHADTKTIDKLENLLKVERDGWQFEYLVKIGAKSKYDYYSERIADDCMVVNNGHLQLPIFSNVETEKSDFDVQEFGTFIKSLDLPFKPRKYQLQAVLDSLRSQKLLSVMCTGSGKSLTIAILLEYFRQHKLNGVLIVPNINLLTQFKNDIKSYNLCDLHQQIQVIGGNSKTKELSAINLTTWQSLKNIQGVQNLDFIICDEVHKFSSSCTSALVQDSINAKYKLGFTGTLPSSKSSKMVLIGLFGLPKNLITSQELIDQGLGTRIHINSIKIKYDIETNQAIDLAPEYLDKLKVLTASDFRNNYIVNLTKRIADGCTLLLYTLIEHGEKLYQLLTGELPSTLERQFELKVFFMNGAVSAKNREQIRKYMDEHQCILIANYSLLSTGVNIKSLKYMIFASPLKSFTTVTQSLGRGIRKHHDKQVFEVYDIVDIFTNCRTFYNQFRERKKIYLKNNFTLD